MVYAQDRTLGRQVLLMLFFLGRLWCKCGIGWSIFCVIMISHETCGVDSDRCWRSNKCKKIWNIEWTWMHKINKSNKTAQSSTNNHWLIFSRPKAKAAAGAKDEGKKGEMVSADHLRTCYGQQSEEPCWVHYQLQGASAIAKLGCRPTVLQGRDEASTSDDQAREIKEAPP